MLTTTYEDTGQPVVLPFRMSAFVLSNLVVTAGMLTPGLSVRSPQFCSIHRILSPSGLAKTTPQLEDDRNPALANHQSISQCRDQFL